MTSVDFSKDTFAVITGASRGIGQAIAVELAKKINENSIILLIARSEKGLNETKSLVLKANSNISVKIASVDLSKPDMDTYNKLIYETMNKATNIELGIIFHNAAQIGSLDKTTELTDLQTWRNYYDLNFFSVSLLNSAFVKKLRGKAKSLVVVNITSICGKKPFKNMSMYGSAKAARDLFFQVFAAEESDITVLNYSPGPVETDMIQEVILNVRDSDVRDEFVSLRQKNIILTPEQTLEKLMAILEKGNFKSGDVIDYFERT